MSLRNIESLRVGMRISFSIPNIAQCPAAVSSAADWWMNEEREQIWVETGTLQIMKASNDPHLEGRREPGTCLGVFWEHYGYPKLSFR